MIASFVNYCFETKSPIKEAWLSDSNHYKNSLISSIPIVGLIFIIRKESSVSKQLLSAIQEKNIEKSVKLINIKNCHKLYFCISCLVLGILSMSQACPVWQTVGLIFCAIQAMRSIYKSHQVIDEIQKQDYQILIENDPCTAPRIRNSWSIFREIGFMMEHNSPPHHHSVYTIY